MIGHEQNDKSEVTGHEQNDKSEVLEQNDKSGVTGHEQNAKSEVTGQEQNDKSAMKGLDNAKSGATRAIIDIERSTIHQAAGGRVIGLPVTGSCQRPSRPPLSCHCGENNAVARGAIIVAWPAGRPRNQPGWSTR